MTLSAQIPPPSSSSPAPTLARCGACRWWSRQTAAIGLCETFDIAQRAEAIACPSWRRRSVSEPRRADA